MFKVDINKGEVKKLEVSGRMGDIAAEYVMIGALITSKMEKDQREAFVGMLEDNNLLFNELRKGDIEPEEMKFGEERKMIDELSCPSAIKKALHKMLDEMEEEDEEE